MKTMMTLLLGLLLISASAGLSAQDTEQQDQQQLRAVQQLEAVRMEQARQLHEQARVRHEHTRQQARPAAVVSVQNAEVVRERAVRDRREYQLARQELQEAARKVAEISAQISPARGYAFRFLTDANRAMLGVSISHDDDISGVRINSVSPGGPAEQAGLQANDVLLAINAVRLDDDELDSPAETVFEVMSELEPGEEVTLEYARDGAIANATVMAERRPPHAFAPLAPMAPLPPGVPSFGQHSRRLVHALHGGFSGGLELVSLNPDLGRYFGTSEGLLVVSVPEDFPAEVRGGDVLLSIDGREPADPQHAFRILRSYQTGENVTLDILRDHDQLSISFAVPENDDPLHSLSMLKGRDAFQVLGGLKDLDLDNIRIKGLQGLQNLNLEDMQSLHILKGLPEALQNDFEILMEDGFINGFHFEFSTDDEVSPTPQSELERVEQKLEQESII